MEAGEQDDAETPDANEAMRHYWNTVAGPRWVASPGFRERRNQESLALLLACLGLAGGESVLEIGCGTGAVTLPLAEAVGEHGRVLAVDISQPMLDAARQRIDESGTHNVKLMLGDAQVMAFEQAAFDVATSRMGVMFFADPVAAFRNIGGALKPGGRLVFACWAPLAENRHWLISHDIALRHLGPPATSADHEPGPLAFGEPRLHPPNAHRFRLHRHRGGACSPDDRRRQSRGRGAAGADDGTDGEADRGETALRDGPSCDCRGDRGGIRGRSECRADPVAGHHLSGHRSQNRGRQT